jgi:hypothetical protein
MPLKESWANRGEEVLMDQAISQSTYRVGEDTDYQDYLEVIERITSKWFAFPEAVASAQIDANPQPTSGANSWEMVENETIQGAYDVERVFERKTTTLVSQTPPPTFGSVTFNPPQNTQLTTWPVNVTIATITPSHRIMYQINAFNSSGAIVYGPWVETSAASVTVSVNTTILAAGATIAGASYHKVLFINAKAFQVLQSGRYESAVASSSYGQRAPSVATPTYNPAGSTSSTPESNIVMPTTVAISCATAGARINATAAYWSSGGSYVTNATVSAALAPVNISISTPFAPDGFQRVRLIASAYVELDGITYTSSSLTRYYRD